MFAECLIGLDSVILANKYAGAAIHTAVSRRLKARWLQLHTPREQACTCNNTMQCNVSTKTRLIGKIINDHTKMSKNMTVRSRSKYEGMGAYWLGRMLSWKKSSQELRTK